MATDERPSKGTFGRARLPVAGRYVALASRNRFLGFSALGAVLLATLLVVSFRSERGPLVSNGPLSSSHANLESNCASCHTPGGSVSNDRCSICHEKFSDSLGLYSFNAHYVYESRDRTRAVAHEGETACVACHVEHEGREATLVSSPDRRCLACHEDHAFAAGHPEFEFTALSVPDDESLTFAHVAHVGRVMDRLGLDDVERACLACHRPDEAGRRFEPIGFDTSCASCHLGAEIQSAVLPVLEPGVRIVTPVGEALELDLGVETLDTIRARLGPGEQWALSASTAQFDVAAGEVTKFGIEHADPWITHNLRLLRRAIQPSAGLPDLLRASAETRPSEKAELYEEALATLRHYADGLRGAPEPWVQDELAEIDATLAAADRRLDDRRTVLNDARFRVALPDERLDAAQMAEIDAFAALVATPCLTCHTVERATIARVHADQQTLHRARFDHRAHVLQRGCLDCHADIPVVEHLGATEPIDEAFDRAAIQNLPSIATCRECHQPSLAADRCLTCHLFHPSPNAWSSELLTVH